MVGTRTLQNRVGRWLPLWAALSGCIPNLDELHQGEAVEGNELSAGSHAGVAGGSGVSGASSGPDAGGAGGAAGTAGSVTAGAASAGAPGAGSGGATPTEPKCEPQGAEICDGEDDDCNGVVDDGCPSGLSTVFDKDLPEIGDSPGGSKFVDDCSDGAVLGGIKLGVDGFLGQVQGICRKLTLQLSPNADSGYEVKLSSDVTLAAHPPTTENPVVTATCPENETLVGLRLSQQNTTLAGGAMAVIIPQVTLSCAKLTLSKQGDGYVVSWEGKRELAPVSGTHANNMAWFVETVVTSGTVATRLGGASGSWIDRLGLGISKVVIAKAQ